MSNEYRGILKMISDDSEANGIEDEDEDDDDDVEDDTDDDSEEHL